MVYIINKDSKPLMPTSRYGHVRKLLKAGRAKVIKRTPFTIQLLYDSKTYTQPISLGIDAGSKHVGISATTDKKELLSAQVELRSDINKNLKTRRDCRRSRRTRKTRYRKPRFQNRVKSKHEGWLAPSVNAKCEAHITIVNKVMKLLPITELYIEMAPFDVQALKAKINGEAKPVGTDYQHGEAEGFDNIKAYVKWRDGYRCAVCGAEHVPLEVHHKVQRHDGGGNSPSNLVTVCSNCHKLYHAGKLTGKKARIMDADTVVKGVNGMKDATFMGIMCWAVWNKLKELDIPMYMTFGYKTAEMRREYDLPKEHRVDARCISGNPTATPSNEWFMCKKVRCHNRQIHKMKINKGGTRKRNQIEYEIKGFRLFDKVEYKGNKHYFIFGRRKTGIFNVRDIYDNKATKCGDISYKKLRLIESQSGYMIDRIMVNN